MPQELGAVGTAVADPAAGGAGSGAGSGAGAGDGAAGGTGAGEGAGEGAGTGAGEGEGTGVEGEGEDTGEGAGEGEGEPAAGEGEGEGDEFERDGRKIDAKTRTAISALKKVDPVAAKAVADAYFRAEGYKAEFPTVQAARQAKATIESLGGEEGITEMQTEIGDYRREIQQFADGDPNLLNQLYGDKGEGAESFAKMTANGLELLATKNPDLFDEAVMPTFVARLERAGMYNKMPQLLNLIKEGKGQEAYDLTLQIDKWLKDAKGFSNKTIEMRKTKDPREEAIATRERQLEQERSDMYTNAVAEDVNRLNNSAMSKVVESFFKDLRLKPEGRREFVNALQQRIWKEMKEDAPFQRAAKSIRDKGDKKRTADFVSSKFTELLPEQFRKLRNDIYPNYKPAGAAGKKVGAAGAGNGKGTAAAAGAVVTSVAGKKPNREDVDWTKTLDTMWIKGRAILKNGKEVKWDWKSV